MNFFGNWQFYYTYCCIVPLSYMVSCKRFFLCLYDPSSFKRIQILRRRKFFSRGENLIIDSCLFTKVTMLLDWTITGWESQVGIILRLQVVLVCELSFSHSQLDSRILL